MTETRQRTRITHAVREASIILISLLILVVATATNVNYLEACTVSEQGVAGIWQGVLEHSGMELLVVFTISLTPDHTLTATMDVPEQDATDIPVDRVILDGCTLRLEITPIDGVFEGELAEDSKLISGEWTQGGATISLELEPTETKPVLKRPQEPVGPFPYGVEEVILQNTDTGTALAGTLTLPSSNGTSPAVLLLSGSGPQDRDEAVFGHRPFLVLADHLTRRGIAVLRVDDRGVGGSTGEFSKATALDFAADARTCITYLRNRKEIDPESIGIIGHSEGGIIASMVSSQMPEVASAVLIASPGLPIREMEHSGEERDLRANGASDNLVSRTRIMNENLFDVIAQESDSAEVMKRFEEIISQTYRDLGEEDREIAGFSAKNLSAYILDRAHRLHSPWFRFYLPYDPGTDMKKITCPVLALNGEKDTQVPAGANLRAIESALEAGGNRNHTVLELPGLNHLLQTAETGAISEYSEIEETMSPVALQVICDWILKQAKVGQETTGTSR